MISYKVSIFFAFLFVGLFASGLSYENGTEDNSLESYRASSCTLKAVSAAIKSSLSELGGPASDWSVNDTLMYVKKVTSLYFNPPCGIPEYKSAYDEVSKVKINAQIDKTIQNGMIAEIAKINLLLSKFASISFDDLLPSINQITYWSNQAFIISYRYAPIQWLICNQLLALSMLGTKLPGANATATNLLNIGIDICSFKLNNVEYQMTEAFLHVKIYVKETLSQRVGMSVVYTSDDTFYYEFFCWNNPAPLSCMLSCGKIDLVLNYAANPFTLAYEKIFHSGYCKTRKAFSLYNNSHNIVAANCLDSHYFLERNFITGTWRSSTSWDGDIVSTFNDGELAKGGIYMRGKHENIFIDIENGKVQNDTVVKCHKVELLTRCELGIPTPQGSCYP